MVKSSENLFDSNLSIDSDSDSSISEESVILNRSNREIQLLDEAAEIVLFRVEKNILLEIVEECYQDLHNDS